MAKKEEKIEEKTTKKTEGGTKMGKGNSFGGWAFIVGVVLAVIFGFFSTTAAWLPWLMVGIGLVIGLLNVSGDETKPFLFAGTVLVIVSAMGGNVFDSTPILQRILYNNQMLFVPATIVVALKSVLSIAKN